MSNERICIILRLIRVLSEKILEESSKIAMSNARARLPDTVDDKILAGPYAEKLLRFVDHLLLGPTSESIAEFGQKRAARVDWLEYMLLAQRLTLKVITDRNENAWTFYVENTFWKGIMGALCRDGTAESEAVLRALRQRMHYKNIEKSFLSQQDGTISAALQGGNRRQRRAMIKQTK